VEAGQMLARPEIPRRSTRRSPRRSRRRQGPREDIAQPSERLPGRPGWPALESLQNARTACWRPPRRASRVAEFITDGIYDDRGCPGPERILRRMAEPGELAGPGQAGARVFGATGRDGFPAPACGTRRPSSRAGRRRPVDFSRPAGPRTPAAVTQIADAADPDARTFEVQLAESRAISHGLRSGTVGSS